jgi:hypothetical protein
LFEGGERDLRAIIYPHNAIFPMPLQAF